MDLGEVVEASYEIRVLRIWFMSRNSLKTIGTFTSEFCWAAGGDMEFDASAGSR